MGQLLNTMRLTTLFFTLFLGQTVLALNPFEDGPYQSVHKTYYPILTSELDHLLDVWVPNTDQHVKSPIIYFVGGLGGLIPGEAYKNVLSKIASHGISVVQPSIIGNNPIDNYDGIWMDDIMAWVEANLRDELINSGVKGGIELDHNSLFMMGHSSGGHVACEYLKRHCGNAKGAIYLSPVDGFDPFGWIPIDCINPGEYLNFAVPQLILPAGLDNVPGIDNLGNIVPACAPNELSNKRFYDAFPDNTWMINATNYGHGDVLDDFYAEAVQWTHFCAVADKNESKEQYRKQVSGLAITFIKFVLGEESCDVLQYLQDSSVLPVTSSISFKQSVLHPEASICDQSDCKWQEEPYPQ